MPSRVIPSTLISSLDFCLTACPTSSPRYLIGTSDLTCLKYNSWLTPFLSKSYPFQYRELPFHQLSKLKHMSHPDFSICLVLNSQFVSRTASSAFRIDPETDQFWLLLLPLPLLLLLLLPLHQLCPTNSITHPSRWTR